MKSVPGIFIVLTLLAVSSCKKEKDPAPAPTPPPVTPPTPRANEMSATINGSVWAVTGNKTSTASVSVNTINTSPKTFGVTGYTQNFSRHSIYVGFPYTMGVGTHSFEIMGNEAYGAYNDPDGTGFFAKTGTINISVFDTSHKKSTVCDKFKATFSFVTVNLGTTYTVTDGVIDYEAP